MILLISYLIIVLLNWIFLRDASKRTETIPDTGEIVVTLFPILNIVFLIALILVFISNVFNTEDFRRKLFLLPKKKGM